MNDNVTPLKIVKSGVTATMSELEFLQSIAMFLREQSILDDWSETDVELEPPHSDEVKIGELSAIERQFFVIGSLLKEVVREEMVELEAANSDKITSIMRERKISMTEAAQVFSENRETYMTEDQRMMLNQCGLTMANVLSTYEWSLRTRLNQWDKAIIIRKGFVAYAYG